MTRTFLLVSFALAACTKDAQFTIDAPAAGLQAESAVALFGVYRDGRLDADYWETLSPRVSPALGGPACAIAFDPALAEHDPKLYSEIDRETKENGVTKEVLARFASRAPTPMIAVLQVTGHPPVPKPRPKEDDSGSAAMGGGGPAGGGRGGMGGGGRHGGGQHGAAQSDALNEEVQRFELVFSLFDASKKDFVSRIAMHYSGTSADDALTQFTAKVKETLPGMKCVSWQ
jgi:hypothetical protein